MQIQTTTITTQNQTVENTSFKITTFEQKTNVMCDLCGDAASGTIQNLENRGWEMNSREEFCPNCN